MNLNETTSLQVIFDTVVDHLFTQGRPAKTILNGALTCAYRGDDGTKCAVGCLLDDEQYDPDLEGNNVQDEAVQLALGLRVTDVLMSDELVQRRIDLLAALQHVHDWEPNWMRDDDGKLIELPYKLREVAVIYGLNQEKTYDR